MSGRRDGNDSPAIVERVLSFLRERGGPVSSAVIVRRVLALTAGSTAAAESILEGFLAGDPRLRRDAEGLWVPAEDREEPAPASIETDVAAAVWVHHAGPRPGYDPPVAIGIALRDGLRSRFPCDPGGPVRPEALRSLGLGPGEIEGAASRPDVLRIVRRAIDERGVVVWDRRHAQSLSPAFPATVTLYPALRRAGILRPGGSPVDAASELGVAWDGDPAADALAAVVLALHDGAREEGLLDFEDPEPAPVEVPTWAQDLSEGPGVYRLLGSDGDVLYVGKARSLRSRVRAYFGRSDRRRRHDELMGRVVGIRTEETGSEAEALLVEAEAIREEAPPYNVQRATAARSGRLGDAVLFLPGRDEGVLAVLLVGGRVAARVEIGPRNRGVGRLDEAIRRHVFRDEAVEEDRGAGEILKTWLRREGDRVSSLDLSLAVSASAASRLVRAYLSDPDLLRGPVLHRS